MLLILFSIYSLILVLFFKLSKLLKSLLLSLIHSIVSLFNVDDSSISSIAIYKSNILYKSNNGFTSPLFNVLSNDINFLST